MLKATLLLTAVLLCGSTCYGDGLVAHWKFDENSGTNVVDATTNNHHGVKYGATWTTNGYVRCALDFDGTNDFVQVPASNQAPPSQIGDLDFGTVAVWFNFREFTNAVLPLFYFGEGSTGTAHNSFIIEIGHNSTSDRKLYFTIVNTWFCFDSNTNLLSNTWHHFCAVVHSNGNTGFLNGHEMLDRHYNLGSDASYTNFLSSVPSYARDVLSFGYGRYGQLDPFHYHDGLIDEIRIYDRPLSPQEIFSLYYDSDQDWMQDSWELENFNSKDVADETTDYDKDGFLDWMEHDAGTQPTNSASLLEITDATEETVGEYVITWKSASNKEYKLMRGTNMFDDFTQVLGSITSTPPNNVYTDSPPAGPETYLYRIGLD